MRALAAAGAQVTGTTRATLDLADPASVARFVAEVGGGRDRRERGEPGRRRDGAAAALHPGAEGVPRRGRGRRRLSRGSATRAARADPSATATHAS
nr:hypothetical protein [Pseudonocardia oroxyli]